MATVLADAFDLDCQTSDLTEISPGMADSEPCTADGCGASPTTGATTGCAVPDGPPVAGNCALV